MGQKGPWEGVGREPEAKRLSARPVSRSHGKCPCGLRVRSQASFSGPDARSDAGAFPSLPPAASSGKFLQRGPSLPQFESHLNLNSYPYPAPSHTHTHTHSPRLRSPCWCGPSSLTGFLFSFFFYPSIFAFRGFPGCDSWSRKESDRTERLN